MPNAVSTGAVAPADLFHEARAGKEAVGSALELMETHAMLALLAKNRGAAAEACEWAVRSALPIPDLGSVAARRSRDLLRSMIAPFGSKELDDAWQPVTGDDGIPDPVIDALLAPEPE